MNAWKNKKYVYQYFFYLNPFILSGLFYLNSLDRFISSSRGIWLVLYYYYYRNFCDIANSIEPDQTPYPSLVSLGIK